MLSIRRSKFSVCLFYQSQPQPQPPRPPLPLPHPSPQPHTQPLQWRRKMAIRMIQRHLLSSKISHKHPMSDISSNKSSSERSIWCVEGSAAFLGVGFRRRFLRLSDTMICLELILCYEFFSSGFRQTKNHFSSPSVSLAFVAFRSVCTATSSRPASEMQRVS